MLVSNFPRVTFVSESGAETNLNLAGEGAAIAALGLEIGRRFPEAKRVGLVFRSTPELLIAWLGVLCFRARAPHPAVSDKKADLDRLVAVDREHD